ncbi:MAG: hypothetical protein ACJA1W_004818, partial [Akkermansiaceae bacterium]
MARFGISEKQPGQGRARARGVRLAADLIPPQGPNYTVPLFPRRGHQEKRGQAARTPRLNPNFRFS